MEKENSLEVIAQYSRAQAIDDGVLIDVSETAKEAGFRFPMAVTSAVWVKCVEVPEVCKGDQDEVGRLWDILSMLRFAIRTKGEDNPIIFITLVRTSWRLDEVLLKAVCGPGDDGEPVLTVMLSNED